VRLISAKAGESSVRATWPSPSLREASFVAASFRSRPFRFTSMVLHTGPLATSSTWSVRWTWVSGTVSSCTVAA